MSKPKLEGLEALAAPPPVPSIEEMTLLDFFAAFALMGYDDSYTPKGKAIRAYETARECLEARLK